MIVGKRKREDEPWFKLSANPLRLHPRTRKPKDGDFRMIHDGGECRAADAAEVGDGEKCPPSISATVIFLSALSAKAATVPTASSTIFFLVHVAITGTSKPDRYPPLLRY